MAWWPQALLCWLAALGSGLAPNPTPKTLVDRKQFACGMAVALSLAPSRPAIALGEFEALRAELDGSGTRGLARLRDLLEREDYSEVIKFTKEYFIFVGKGIMTSARKDLANDTDKDTAKDLYNRVQEDLIAINKLSRPKGLENKEEALRYLATLEDDMHLFLKLDPSPVR